MNLQPYGVSSWATASVTLWNAISGTMNISPAQSRLGKQSRQDMPDESLLDDYDTDAANLADAPDLTDDGEDE